MGSEGMTLEEALDRISALEEELADSQGECMGMYDESEVAAAIADKLANPTEKTCRRCYSTFWASDDDQQYCSRDCREFRRQEPFETLWKRLHPNGSREPNRKFAATV